MLIFEFKDQASKAQEFAAACRERGKDAWVWSDHQALDEAFKAGDPGADLFPFVIDGTVVTVDRDEDEKVERTFRQMVDAFGGTFVGT